MSFQYHAYDYQPNGSAKVCFWFAKKSLSILEAIASDNDLPTYEEAMLWLIYSYEERPFTWNFNHCKKPKFWFGDRVFLVNSDREGIILGMK